MTLEAKSIDTRLGELWLTDEGERIELDLLHRMEVPIELDEDAARELHAYLGAWIDEKRGPQQELEVEEAVDTSHLTTSPGGDAAGAPSSPGFVDGAELEADAPPGEDPRVQAVARVLDPDAFTGRGYGEGAAAQSRESALQTAVEAVAAVDAVGEPLSDPLAETELGPFAKDSETSRQAALEAYPKQHTQRYRILQLFIDPLLRGEVRSGRPIGARGFTRDEMAQALGMSPNTIRPRVVELMDGGWLEVLDGVTRPSAAGHGSEVLVLSEKARAETSAPQSS